MLDILPPLMQYWNKQNKQTKTQVYLGAHKTSLQTKPGLFQ